MNPFERVRSLPEVCLGPVRLGEGVLELRTPRLSDAAAWSEARLANRQWLERAFPAWGDDWAAEQSPSAWVERWWHLQRLRHEVDARPFVLLLDGRLVGELGVDAVDTESGGGEASVWMVRDHGSAAVMNVASLLLIEHVFAEPRPMDRLISPVATTSRQGRAPGLTAVGFEIEATLPRPVGRGPAADHDIWVLHNTPTTRARAGRALAAMSGSDRPVPATHRAPPTKVAASVPAAARPLTRGLRRTLQRASKRRSETTSATRYVDADGVRVAVDAVGVVTADGALAGRVPATADVGTATATLRPHPDGPDAGPTLAAAAALLADDVVSWAPGSRWVEVRVGPAADGVGESLARYGFEHVATFRGNPDGPRRWRGEQVWTRTVR